MGAHEYRVAMSSLPYSVHTRVPGLQLHRRGLFKAKCARCALLQRRLFACTIPAWIACPQFHLAFPLLPQCSIR